MQDDRAMAALLKALGDAQASRRKAQLRLDQIAQETRRLQAQVAESEATIQRTQAAMRSLLDDGAARAGSAEGRRDSAPADQADHPGRELRPPKPAVRANLEVKSTRFAELKIPQAATIVLREEGGPLHVNELYSRMVENGFRFGGDNHLISLSVSLNRNPRFRKVGPGVFDLVIRDAGQVA